MFTLTIYFIVLNVYVEFVLIYRPHPVDSLFEESTAWTQYMRSRLRRLSIWGVNSQDSVWMDKKLRLASARITE